MAGFDLVICGTTMVSAAKTMRCDVGTRKGRTAALGERLEGGRTSDARRDPAAGGAATRQINERPAPSSSFEESRMEAAGMRGRSLVGRPAALIF